MPKLIILPGMDGTGELLADFEAALLDQLEFQVIGYPRDAHLDYEGLADFVVERLPKSESYVLLGESFGGPLALSIAARPPDGLVGVVLCASFARFPTPSVRALAPLLRFAPILIPPRSVLGWLLLGRWASAPLLVRLIEVLAGLSPAVLRVRIVGALRVDALGAVSRLALPLLCIRASKDRVVSAAAASAIAAVAADCRVIEVDAPHFMLQVAPSECAEIVLSFCGSLMPDLTAARNHA